MTPVYKKGDPLEDNLTFMLMIFRANAEHAEAARELQALGQLMTGVRIPRPTDR